METVPAIPVIEIVIASRMATAGRRVTKAFGRTFRRRVVTRSTMIAVPATADQEDADLEIEGREIEDLGIATTIGTISS